MAMGDWVDYAKTLISGGSGNTTTGSTTATSSTLTVDNLSAAGQAMGGYLVPGTVVSQAQMNAYQQMAQSQSSPQVYYTNTLGTGNFNTASVSIEPWTEELPKSKIDSVIDDIIKGL